MRLIKGMKRIESVENVRLQAENIVIQTWNSPETRLNGMRLPALCTDKEVRVFVRASERDNNDVLMMIHRRVQKRFNDYTNDSPFQIRR